jgi:hypothetical protein
MIKTIKYLDWNIIKLAALTTKGLKQKTTIKSEWKIKALLSEHSILYFSEIVLEVEMQYKTAIHLKTHNKSKGFYLLMQSQRPDWTDKPRDPDAIIKTILTVNPAALIDISRKRMCNTTAKHTQSQWHAIINHIRVTEPEIADACMANCEYRKQCTEFETCGYWDKIQMME